MERCFVRGVWLGAGGVLKGMLALAALAVPAAMAAPSDVLISTKEEARAFSDSEPLIFDGQTLTVLTSFSTGRDIWLHSDASIVVGPGVKFELAGHIGSDGQMGPRLQKRGLGTLTISGQNAYHGITILQEGVLNVSGRSALGDRFYPIEQFAGTELSLDAGASLDNFIQIRPSAGERSLPGLDGVAQWRVDQGTAVLEREVNSRLPIRKTGAGTLRLQHMVMGRPDVLVAEGALAIESSADARVTIGSGARLEGAGQLVDLRVMGGGMAAPGGKEGVATLSVWGDARFDAGSIYHVNALPNGRADLLKVDGKALLDGRVQAQAGRGDWAKENRYRILSAGGGLDGSRFADVETDLAFLDPALDYDERNVYLTLTRNDLQPGDVAETPKEEEIGDAIAPPTRPGRRPRPPQKPTRPGPTEPQQPGPEKPVARPPEEPEREPGHREPADPQEGLTPDAPLLPEQTDASPSPLLDVIEGMSVAQTRSLLRQSGGDWHASVRSFLLEDGRHVRQAVLNSGDLDSAHDARLPSGTRAWAQTYAAMGHRSAAAGVDGDRHRSRGLVLGLDADAAAGWRPGIVLAAQSARLKRSGGRAAARMDTLHAGGSVIRDWNGARLTAALLRSWHRVDSQRRVMAGPLRELQRASYTARSWQAMVDVVPYLHRLIRPYLRHEWMRLSVPAHEEKGGLSAHGVLPERMTMHATTLGWRYARAWQSGTTPGWLKADLGWRHVWGDGLVHSTQYFLDGEGPAPAARRFTSQGRPLARDAVSASLEAGIAPARNAQLSLRYAGLYGGGYRDHAAWADIRWAF